MSFLGLLATLFIILALSHFLGWYVILLLLLPVAVIMGKGNKFPDLF